MADDTRVRDDVGMQRPDGLGAPSEDGQPGRGSEDATPASCETRRKPDVLGRCPVRDCRAVMVAGALDPWDDTDTDLKDYDIGPRGAWECGAGHSGWRWDDMSYADLIRNKERGAIDAGFDVDVVHAALFPFQRDTVKWALRKGRCALFEDTGLGKTLQQLVWAHEVCRHSGGRVLILAPLAVCEQTCREATKFGIDGIRKALDQGDVCGPITITNYERLDKFDVSSFAGVVLDESSILKNYTGSMRRRLTEVCASVPYRLACTATPAPNDHLELGTHAEFLGVMSSHKMIARWFITDQREAGKYRLKGHAVRPFWDWVTSWARCIGKPSDVGPYSDEGYDLPDLREHRHFAEVDIVAGREEGMLFRLPEINATSIHKELRATVAERAEVVAAIVNADPTEPWVIWVDTNYDADAVLEVLPRAVDVRGSMSADEKVRRLADFSSVGGVILTKPGIAGMGLNWQHCARVVFNGLSFSYERYYQAVRRCWRFGQTRPVDVHVVMAKTQASIWGVIDRKKDDHDTMKVAMFAASRRSNAAEAFEDAYQPSAVVELPQWLRSQQ